MTTTAQRAHILIVEDSPTQAQQLKLVLERHGYEVAVAGNGEEALSAMALREPAMVLSDVVMPGMDGYELCSAIKERPASGGIPVVLVTSLSDASDVLRALESGADGFVTKPYDDRHLLSLVRRILHGVGLAPEEAAEEELEVTLDGRRYVIGAGRARMLNLLLSSYEAAVRRNRELTETQEQFRELNETLEEKVQQRTAALADEVVERRRVEQEVRQLNAELEGRVRQRTAELQAANEELEAFVYSVSHDLRAPLRGMDGFSQALLEDYGGRLDATATDYVQRVRGAAERMGELIEDLLELSRITRADMKRQTVDLSEMARSVASALEQAEPERAMEFSVRDGLVAEADASLMRSVLENLVGNAWKFTSGRPQARVEFGRIETEAGPAFFVRDNGAGFDMRYAGKLFGAFQRLHSAREFPGTGIGLATVRRIIRRHGGRIWAEGAVGKGATFYFTL